MVNYALMVEMDDPTSYREAINSDEREEWIESMTEEVESLDKKRLGILWSYLKGREQLVASGSIKRRKGCL